MKIVISFLLIGLLMTTYARADLYEQEITGYVLKVKTDFPYPFTTKEGHVWQCKIRILVCTPYGDCYIYKAYPLHGSDTEWTCNGSPGRLGLQRGDLVTSLVLKKKPDNRRGEIKALEVIDGK